MRTFNWWGSSFVCFVPGLGLLPFPLISFNRSFGQGVQSSLFALESLLGFVWANLPTVRFPALEWWLGILEGKSQTTSNPLISPDPQLSKSNILTFSFSQYFCPYFACWCSAGEGMTISHPFWFPLRGPKPGFIPFLLPFSQQVSEAPRFYIFR